MTEKSAESFEQWRARIDAQLEAGRHALSAPAVVASHRSILARMTRRTNALKAAHGEKRGIELAGELLEHEEM